jgi:hypothetical protein
VFGNDLLNGRTVFVWSVEAFVFINQQQVLHVGLLLMGLGDFWPFSRETDEKGGDRHFDRNIFEASGDRCDGAAIRACAIVWRN